MLKIDYKFLDEHDPALQQIEEVIARVGRNSKTINYTDLVKGITFKPQGIHHTITISEWTFENRVIVGEYLTYISEYSLKLAIPFMASALVVSEINNKPSDSFFEKAILLNAFKPGQDKDIFFNGEIDKAYRYYRNATSFYLVP